jgi:DNA-binding CsgD family transcriptional regulator
MDSLTAEDYRQALGVLRVLTRTRSRADYVRVLAVELERLIPCDASMVESGSSDAGAFGTFSAGTPQPGRRSRAPHGGAAMRHRLVIVLADSAQASIRVVFSRALQGFSERDRAVLDLLAPHLRAGYEAVVAREWPMSIARATERADLGPLSSRERQVLALVSEGSTNQAVASSLGISARTVQKHLEHIFRKLQVQSRTAAAARVHRA